MKLGVWVVLFATLGFAAAIAACPNKTDRPSAAAAEPSESKGPPPLVVNKDAPLLLAEPEEPAEPDYFDVPQGPVADNSACFVCHTNYEEEPFAVYHSKANVSCVKCHGESHAHRDDEDNVTPPDVMYPPEKIEENCADCHDSHDAPAVKIIAQWQKCCPHKTDPKDVGCMDCHGKHRLKIRTVWWNKTTGELILRRKGETSKLRPDPSAEKSEDQPEDKME